MPDLTRKTEMAKVLADIRHAHRAVKLTTMEDPGQVKALMDNLIAETIALRAANEGTLGDKAIKELKNVRNSILAGNIKTGNETARYISKITMILDEVEKVDKKRREDKTGVSSVVSKGAKTIKSYLPSSETVIEGLIMANPVVGYGLKLVKDLFESRSEEKKERKAERQEEIKNIKLDDDEGGGRLQKMEEDGDKLQKISDGNSLVSSDEVLKRLDDIDEGVNKLYKVWEPTEKETTTSADETNSNLEKINKNIEESNSKLTKVQKNTDDSSKELKTSNKQAVKRERDERGRFKSSKLTERADEYKSKHGELGEVAKSEVKGDLLGGILGKLGIARLLAKGGLLGGGLLEGILTGTLITSMLKKVVLGGWGVLKKIFSVPKKLGAETLLKGAKGLKGLALLDPVTWLYAAAADAIWGGLKGLYDPNKALGLDKNHKVDVTERLNGMVSGSIQEVLSTVNDILGVFGENFAKNDDEIRTKVNSALKETDEWAAGIYDSLDTFFGVKKSKPGQVTLKNLWNATVGWLDDLNGDIENWVDNSTVGKTANKIQDSIKKFFGNLVEKSVSMFDSISEWFSDAWTSTKNAIQKGIDSVKNGVSDAGKAVQDTAREILGSLGITDGATKSPSSLVDQVGIVRPGQALANAQRTPENAGGASKGTTIIAPNTVTTVNNQYMGGTSGARNKDRSYNDIRYNNNRLAHLL